MKHVFVYFTASVICCAAVGAAGLDFSSWRKGREAGSNPAIQQAETVAAAGKYKKAARAFSRIEKKTPDDTVAAYAALAQADSYYQARKHFKAMDAYKHAINRYPQSGDYTHALDMLAVIAEDFAQARTKGVFKGFHKKEARELYRQVISLAPFGDKAANHMLRLAELEREANEVNEAINTYQLILKRFAGTTYAGIARLELAQTFLNEAQRTRDTLRLAESAELYADQALRQDSNQPDALKIKRKVEKIYAGYYHYLGEFYSGKAHYNPRAATRYYSKVQKDYPETEKASDAQVQLTMLAGKETQSGQTVSKPADIREVPDPEKAIDGLKIDETAAPDDVVPKVIPDDGRPEKYLLPLDDLEL